MPTLLTLRMFSSHLRRDDIRSRLHRILREYRCNDLLVNLTLVVSLSLSMNYSCFVNALNSKIIAKHGGMNDKYIQCFVNCMIFFLLKEHSFRHWFVFYLEDKFQTVDETKSNTTQFMYGIPYAQGSIGPILMLMLMLMTCTAHVSNTAAHGA